MQTQICPDSQYMYLSSQIIALERRDAYQLPVSKCKIIWRQNHSKHWGSFY